MIILIITQISVLGTFTSVSTRSLNMLCLYKPQFKVFLNLGVIYNLLYPCTLHDYYLTTLLTTPMSNYKPLSSLFATRGSNLESLLERAQYLQNLTGILRENIDPVFSSHISVANLRGDTVIITAASPAWLSKIRYLAPVILQMLKQEPGLQGLSNIQFKVQPADEPQPQDQTTRHIRLSTSSSEILESAAAGISDPELANALKRLSQKGQSRSD